jgi:hypothetical protein
MPETIVDAIVSATSGNHGQTQAQQAGNLHRFSNVEWRRDNHGERPKGRDNASNEGERPPSKRHGQPDSFAASKVIVH